MPPVELSRVCAHLGGRERARIARRQRLGELFAPRSQRPTQAAALGTVMAVRSTTEHSVHQFGTRCGSPLFLFERDAPTVVESATGTLDEPHGIVSARVLLGYAHQRSGWARISNSVQ